jgi:hypothetical protein
MSRPNPPRLANALCCFGFSGIFLIMVIHSLVDGSFLWSVGRRSGRERMIVSAETHPVFYWGWLGFWALIALWIGYLGWKEVRALRKQRGSRARHS